MIKLLGKVLLWLFFWPFLLVGKLLRHKPKKHKARRKKKGVKQTSIQSSKTSTASAAAKKGGCGTWLGYIVLGFIMLAFFGALVSPAVEPSVETNTTASNQLTAATKDSKDESSVEVESAELKSIVDNNSPLLPTTEVQAASLDERPTKNDEPLAQSIGEVDDSDALAKPPPIEDREVSPSATATPTSLPTATQTAASAVSPEQSTSTSTATSEPTLKSTTTPTAANTATLTPSSTATSTTSPTETATHTAVPIVSGAAVDGTAAKVVGIVDGDTIDVLLDGVEQRVRYIGIDTPERGQPGFGAATAVNRALVEGQVVYLVADRDDVDRNDRLLRYVFLADGTHVNEVLVSEGWAQPVVYEPNVAYADQFLALSVVSAEQRQGFWSGQSEVDGAMPYAFSVGADRINLRSGPGTGFEPSGGVPARTPLTIFGRNEPGDWIQIRTPLGDGGWIYAPLVQINVPANEIAVASKIPVLPVIVAATATTQPVTQPATPPTEPSNAQSVAPVVAASSIKIVAVDKKAEFVILQNFGTDAVNLRGWRLHSERGSQDWTVGFDFMLQSGAQVRIHALSGTNDGANLYSGFGSNIWNNSKHDPAVLYDPSGSEVSRY